MGVMTENTAKGDTSPKPYWTKNPGVMVIIIFFFIIFIFITVIKNPETPTVLRMDHTILIHVEEVKEP